MKRTIGIWTVGLGLLVSSLVGWADRGIGSGIPRLARDSNWSEQVEDLVYDIVVSGNRAFLAKGVEGVVEWDISNPSDPVETGRLKTKGSAQHLYQHGNRLVVGNAANLIHMLDVSRQGEMRFVGLYEGRDRYIALDGVGSIVYAVTQRGIGLDGRFSVIDFSDPSQPELIRYRGQTGVYDLEVSDGYAYVAAGNLGVKVLDLSDPVNPVIRGEFGRQGVNYTAIAASSFYVYTNGERSGLEVLDASDPDHLRSVSRIGLEDPVGAREIAAGDDLLVVHAGLGKSIIYDVADRLAEPSILSQVHSGANVSGLAIANEVVWIADRNPSGVFSWVDIFGETLGHLNLKSAPRKVIKDQGRVFSIDDVRGLELLESDPSGALIVRGQILPERGAFLDFEVRYPLVYGVTSEGLLEVLDFSDVEQPMKLSGQRIGVVGLDICLSGNEAYVAMGSEGMQVFSLSDPALPVKIGGLRQRSVWSVEVRDGTAFLSADVSGVLLVVDVTAPNDPQLLASRQVGSLFNEGNHIQLWKDWVLMAGTGGGNTSGNGAVPGGDVHLVDISNLSEPRKLGSLVTMNGGADDVAVYEGIAAVVTRDGVLELYDLEQDSRPLVDSYRFGSHDFGRERSRVTFDRDGIFVAHGNYGLLHFCLSSQAQLGGIRLDQIGLPVLSIQGQEEGLVEIFASDDLVEWISIGIHDLSLGTSFRDESASGNKMRFYTLEDPRN